MSQNKYLNKKIKRDKNIKGEKNETKNKNKKNNDEIVKENIITGNRNLLKKIKN